MIQPIFIQLETKDLYLKFFKHQFNYLKKKLVQCNTLFYRIFWSSVLGIVCLLYYNFISFLKKINFEKKLPIVPGKIVTFNNWNFIKGRFCKKRKFDIQRIIFHYKSRILFDICLQFRKEKLKNFVFYPQLN